MAKYINLEDAKGKFEFYTKDMLGSWIAAMLDSLPTIEISENCIDREWILNKTESGFNKLGEDYDINYMQRDIEDAPSVIPQVPNEDAISREMVSKRLAELWETEHPEKSYDKWLKIASEWCDYFPSVIPKRSCYRCGLREDCEDSTERKPKEGAKMKGADDE